MSKLVKGIGKVFKKIVKTVVKIAPYALAAAAVVFTGGAALGLTPTFAAATGGLVAKLGLSAAMSGALTGAITSAGFGAAIGGITGGKKGLQKGALMGALTGGVMGAMSPASFGIVKGADGAVTTANAMRNGGNAFAAAGQSTGMAPTAGTAPVGTEALPPSSAPQSALPTNTNLIGPGGEIARSGGTAAAGTAVSGGMTPVAAATQAATTGMAPQGGILGAINANPSLAGNLISGAAAALGGGDEVDDYRDKTKIDTEAERKRNEAAYGGVYTGSDAFGMKGRSYAVPPPRFYYDTQKNRVVDRHEEGG